MEAHRLSPMDRPMAFSSILFTDENSLTISGDGDMCFHSFFAIAIGFLDFFASLQAESPAPISPCPDAPGDLSWPWCRYPV